MGRNQAVKRLKMKYEKNVAKKDEMRKKTHYNRLTKRLEI